MKSIRTAGLTVLLLFSGLAQALDPVPGLYGGLFLGVTQTPAATVSFFNVNTFINTGTFVPASGKLNYSIFGDIGGEIGYRFNQFRAEAELLFNQSPYRKFTVGGFQVTSSKSTTYRFSGHTREVALMLNGLFDIYTLQEQSCYVPYLGLGVGYVNVQNGIQLYYNNVAIPGTSVSNHQNAFAAQFILGLNYFMDDFTTIGLDYRYWTSKSVPPITTRTAFNSLNLSLTGAFDLG